MWTSGTASWFKLARMGIWVEGCAEGLGFEALIPSLREPVLRLPSLVNWKVLTHFGAHADWLKLGMLPVPTYRIRAQYGQEARSQLQQATHVFWSSGSQLNELKDHVSQDVRHACGPGKTADRLRELGIEPDIFPKVEEWRKWIKG